MSRSNTFMLSLSKWLNRLSPLLLLLAVVWLCWGLARITWLVVAPPQAPKLEILPRQAEIQSQKTNMSGIFNVFKEQSIAKKREPAKKQAASKPSNLKLKGIMEASPMSNSSAMIEVNGQIKNYRIGKKIEGTDFTLTLVDWEKIIIENSQNQETIIKLNEPMELDQEFIAKKSNNNRSLNSRSHNRKGKFSGQNTTNTSRTANASQNSANRSNTNSTSNKSANQPSNNLTNNSTNNSTNPTNANTPTPNKANSSQPKVPTEYLNKMGINSSGQGYSVTDSIPASVRSKIGLKAGDKILTVNGQNVGSNPQDDAKILQQVQQSGQAQIQVQRGNQVITIRQQLKK